MAWAMRTIDSACAIDSPKVIQINDAKRPTAVGMPRGLSNHSIPSAAIRHAGQCVDIRQGRALVSLPAGAHQLAK
jgi:hypothetical protein